MAPTIKKRCLLLMFKDHLVFCSMLDVRMTLDAIGGCMIGRAKKKERCGDSHPFICMLMTNVATFLSIFFVLLHSPPSFHPAWSLSPPFAAHTDTAIIGAVTLSQSPGATRKKKEKKERAISKAPLGLTPTTLVQFPNLQTHTRLLFFFFPFLLPTIFTSPKMIEPATAATAAASTTTTATLPVLPDDCIYEVFQHLSAKGNFCYDLFIR